MRRWGWDLRLQSGVLAGQVLEEWRHVGGVNQSAVRVVDAALATIEPCGPPGEESPDMEPFCWR
ncbi:MAG TPA: hypothetical protein VF221_20220 [Chloroflexota bacterium]